MVMLYGSFQPMDDLTVDAQLYWFWAHEDYLSAGATGSNIGDEIGTELDFGVTYDYTEDVTFGTQFAFFMPGDVYNSDLGTTGGDNDATAVQILNHVSVSY